MRLPETWSTCGNLSIFGDMVIFRRHRGSEVPSVKLSLISTCFFKWQSSARSPEEKYTTNIEQPLVLFSHGYSGDIAVGMNETCTRIVEMSPFREGTGSGLTGATLEMVDRSILKQQDFCVKSKRCLKSQGQSLPPLSSELDTYQTVFGRGFQAQVPRTF